MLILLSPSKALNFERQPPAGLNPTRPRLAQETERLLARLRTASAAELQRLMGLSDQLAALNRARYETFDTASEHPAIFAFAGDVYTGFAVEQLSLDDLAWAQRHVRILSGLYGLLRPLDLIRPYRLEMGVRLANERAADLAGFWREPLRAQLRADLAESGGEVVLNLASDEYFAAVDARSLDARIITPTFYDVRDGQARALFLYLKQARGAMARFAVQNKASDPEQLHGFREGGYRFEAQASTPQRWVFQRPQPPAKRKTRPTGENARD